MEEVTTTIITKLIELAPVVAVLIYFIIYFKGVIKEKDDQIKELNAYIRESDKATIVALEKLCQAVDSLKEIIKKS